MSRIKKQILSKLKEYGSKMGTNTMGGDDYISCKRGGLRDNDGYDNVQYNKDMPMDEAITPPNSKKVEALKKAVQKINRKYKVQVSKIGPTKGEVEIELGDGNHPDRDYHTIEKLVKKLGIKHYSVFNESINEAIPQNFHQGRVSDYHTALRGKKKDYSGGTNFKKKNHGQPDIDTDDEDQETNQLSNQQLHVKAKLKVAESGKDKSKKNYKDWKSSRLRKEISKKLKEYGQRLDLSFIEDEEARLDGTYPPTDAIDRDIDETAKRDYKDEYKKFQSSKKSKKYRAELNKYNRDKGTYGNGDGKDASHKG